MRLRDERGRLPRPYIDPTIRFAAYCVVAVAFVVICLVIAAIVTIVKSAWSL